MKTCIYTPKVIITIIVLITGYSFIVPKMSPANLFTIRPKEKLTLKQQKERIKYGKLLQPIVENDSLVVRCNVKVPSKYREYAEAYAHLLNKYLEQLPAEARFSTLRIVQANSIPQLVVMNSYIIAMDSTYVFTISEKDAVFIGVQKEYEAIKEINSRIKTLEASLPKEFRQTDRLSEETSIFCNHFLIQNTMSDLFNNFKKDFDQLNTLFH